MVTPTVISTDNPHESPPRSRWQQVIGCLSIRQKLLYSYGLSIGVTILGSTLGIVIGTYQYDRARLKAEIINTRVNLLCDVQGQLLAIEIHESELAALKGGTSGLRYGVSEIKEHGRNIFQILTKLKTSSQEHPIPMSHYQAFLDKYDNVLIRYSENLEKFINQLEVLVKTPGGNQQIQSLMREFLEDSDSVKVHEFSHEVIHITEDFRELQSKELQAQIQARTLELWIIAGGLVLSILFAGLLAFLIGQTISQPINTVTRLARRIAQEKNFEFQVPVTSVDEIGSLAGSFNNLILEVNHLMAEQRQAKQDAENANASKSEFLASMSHELRTPLNGVLGYAQVLQRDQKLTPKQQEGIKVIYQCGTHLLTLINDILDISKIEAGRMEMELHEFHLLSLLEGVGEISRIRAEQKEISFAYQFSVQLPEGVYGDEHRLRQVLLNLLGNAIKFTDRGGVTFQVTVNETDVSSNPGDVAGGQVEDSKGVPLSEGVSVDSDQPSPFTYEATRSIRFQVTDTGVGMTPEQIEKIFLPFEQVGNYQRKSEGIGLGLAISQKIAQLMGSTIQVTSQPGQGSSFWFDINLPEVKNWAQSIRRIEQGRVVGYTGGSKKVLVIDDKWENRSIIVNLLGGIGFELAEASNGEEGLAQAELFYPDLIVVDLVMPVLDGFEFCRRLRQIPHFQYTRVIVTSASVFEAERQKCFSGGADDFLAKPIQVSELFNKLKTHLQIEWVYETDEKSSGTKDAEATFSNRESETADVFITPDRDLLETLLDLAKRGNMPGIEQKVEELKQQNVSYLPFLLHLETLASSFQRDKIKELIESYL